METDPCSDDLHLVLDTSTDASDNKDATESESEGPTFNSPKPVSKPSGIQVKSADGKPKRVQITTLSTLSSQSAAKSSLSESPKAAAIPGIQVKSADGKPKKVQITTLATFTSPKSKSQGKTNSTTEEQLKGDKSNALKSVENTFIDKPQTVQKDKAPKIEESAKSLETIDLTADEKGDNSKQGEQTGLSQSDPVAASSPVGTKTNSEGKGTPKRVQLTTIQLFKK